jgi:hypothetical protein
VEKVQELTMGSGVAGIEEGRCGDGGSMENRASVARSCGRTNLSYTGSSALILSRKAVRALLSP